MPRYTFYKKSNGQITATRELLSDVEADMNAAIDEVWIKGNYTSTSYRIVEGRPEPISEKPIYPARFDYDTGHWVWDERASWNDLRAKRDKLLSASDWTQSPDAPVDRQAWAEYRQALRDLPANTQDPREPVWPTPPS